MVVGSDGRPQPAPLRRGFSCIAGPNRFNVSLHWKSYGGLLMQKWELTFEIVGSAIVIGSLLFLLWFLGFVS